MKKYNMVTVDEYLNVLGNNNKFNLKDIDTMISVEKYLTEIVSGEDNKKAVNE